MGHAQKSDTNLGGKTLAAQGVNGAKSLGSDTKSGFPYAGSMAGQGYVGSINKYKSSASSAGRVVAEATLKTLKKVLGIASPSKVMAEQGMWTVLGYVEGIDKYASKAEQATKDMANASVKAISTTNEMMNYSGNVPTTTNAGYGIGMANQGAMASLASNIYNAIASGMAGMNTGSGDIKVIIDGKEVFNVVQSESRKRGVAISNGAFSTI